MSSRDTTSSTSPPSSLILIKANKEKNGSLNRESSTVKLNDKSRPKANKNRTKRGKSLPVTKRITDDTDTVSLENNSNSCFPSTCQYSGYLDVRTKSDKEWKRRYFVVNNNFLLSAATPHAQKLERMICLEGSKISKHLKSGDMTFELFIRRRKLYFRAPSPKLCTRWTAEIEKASKLKIKDIYRFLYELGEGQANVKVVAAKHKTTNEDCAIKIVDKRMCDKKMLKTEIQILKKIDHPSMVSIYDLIETKKYLYVVMEKCDGGELFDRIAELDGDGFTEEDTCLIMHQICHAVKYMNDKGIVHRDLKPENILCTQQNSIKKIKVCDFGISKMLKSKDQPMTTLCGTLAYTAPEILKQKRAYDYTCDYWSIGVIMYILLCGYPPFYGETDKEVEHNIIKNEVEFEDEDWEHISSQTKQLVAGLLNKSPRKRLGPDDVLKLTWKVSATSNGWIKSHHRFKQTVIKAKFHRHSMTLDLQQKSTMFSLFRPQSMENQVNFQEEKRQSSITQLKGAQSIPSHIRKISINRASRGSISKDDMDPINSDVHNIAKYERKMAAFRGNRQSKGTEELFELKGLIHSPLPLIEDETE